MFTSIAGRAVVVTGATRGIGKGIARVFAESGARVLVVGRDEGAARATVAELSADAADASYALADVSSLDDCQRMADVAVERLERRSSSGPGFGVVPTCDRRVCYSLLVAGGEGSATGREEVRCVLRCGGRRWSRRRRSGR